MRVIRFNFLFMVGLVLTLGISTAFASGGDKSKAPKDMGTLSVRTTPVPLSVKVDGQYVGMSGVGTPAEFFVTPGFHTVEVAGPDGSKYSKADVEFRRGAKNCICLKVVNRPACPYRFNLERSSDTIMKGETVTFTAKNSGTAPTPTRYKWSVAPGTGADIVTGQGTSSITVSSKDLSGREITAELDSNDDNYVYDNRCKAEISVPLKPPACPYRFQIDRSAYSLREGETVTFTANNVENAPTPMAYNWIVTPSSASDTVTGQGTSTITVSSTGLAGQQITAALDQNGDSYDYDNRCKAENSVPVGAGGGELIAWDLEKANMDNIPIQLGNNPNSTVYIHIYPGTDKASRTIYSYDRVYRKLLEYLTVNRKVEPERIKFAKGGTRVGRTYVRSWVIPPGGEPPPIDSPPSGRRRH